MWNLFIISIFVFATLNAEEKLCNKYAKLGTIENKAFLSPIIIMGNASMKIPIGDKYRMTIYIKSKVKGSFVNWKNDLLIAGDFSDSTPQNANDPCSFQSEVNKEYIYFLKQSVTEKGAFDVVFKPILLNPQILSTIKSVLCKSCSGPPNLIITELENTKDKSIFQCINTNKPSAKVKWEIINRQTNVFLAETSKGAQLKIINPQSANEQMYVCIADSVAGTSKAFLSYHRKFNTPTVRPSIIRCAKNDKSLCSGKGQCYEDNGAAFCRCFQGYSNIDCSLRTGRSNSLERKSMLDGNLCSSNGYAYHNTQTKDTFCVCKDKFSGKTCSVSENKSTNNDKNYKRMIQTILVSATAKNAIVGALLVVGGCFFVIFVIVAIWRCYIAKLKSMEKEEESNREENHKVTGSHRAPAYDEEVQLVPSTNNKPPSGPVPPKNNYNGNKGNDRNQNDWNLDMSDLRSEKL